MSEKHTPEVVLVARNQSIADMIEACARKELPFSGPDSLCSRVHAMGYSTLSLYEMVHATEASLLTRIKGGTDA